MLISLRLNLRLKGAVNTHQTHVERANILTKYEISNRGVKKTYLEQV